MRVLVIEDNPDIVANLYGYLEPLGYILDSERNGDAGLLSAGRNAYDAIVLDLALPGIDGLELCRRLRKELRQSTPVLILTARDTIQDKIVGFKSGADDYLVKPFLLAELDVRLKALMRRARDAHVETVMQVGDLRFDTTTRTVTRSGRRIELQAAGAADASCAESGDPGSTGIRHLGRRAAGQRRAAHAHTFAASGVR